MIHAKLIPSIEKVFLDTPIDSLPVLDHIYAYRNHTVSFQIALRGDSYDPHRHFASIRWEGIPDEAVTLRQVDLVPSLMPASPAGFDAGYVRTTPGLYPDLLRPLDPKNELFVTYGELKSLLRQTDQNRVGRRGYDQGAAEKEAV